MREKERYKYLPDGVCFKLVDTETNEGIISKESVQKLLNQQDKRIKEIEQENKQLKQQLEEYKIYKDWQDILCCKSAQEVIDFVMSNYLTEDEKLRTIADLKQQLHDLPKKIVEEIKENFDWRQCCEIRKYYDQQYIWFNYDEIYNFSKTKQRRC